MKKIKGVITALITPFQHGKVDFVSLERLVRQQLQDGVEGFVINGTTAESPTLKESERSEIFKKVRSWVPAGFPLLMGTGSNSTEKTVEESKAAEKLGADAILVVVPYYNKPPQRGLLEHFKAVASSVTIPTVLYNVPGRTVAGLELETIKKLSEHPQIIGIKEATGNIEFAKQIRAACGREFILLSGDDGTYDDFMEVGGDGVISVASHVIPVAMKKAQASQHLDLINLLFCEANPIPVKMALHQMGLIASPECRLPLVTLSEAWSEKMRAQLKKEGLLR
jgi:4-hydroxy-tetrahydrodipicolinate synthase